MNTSENLITNVYNRKITSLNGKWKIIIDQYDCGVHDAMHNPNSLNFQICDAKLKPRKFLEYDFEKSEQLNVPGDWNSQQDKLLFYEGSIWYKNQFDYNLKKGKKLFLYFGAINYYSKVFINGEEVAEHEGGFSPFNCDVTKYLKPKNNYVVVLTNNVRKQEQVPNSLTDWWNYGGITRDVMLVETSEIFVEDYFIQLKKSSNNTVDGWVKLNEKKANKKIKISIKELNLEKEVITNAQGKAKINFKADMQLWSPDNPKLYDVIIKMDKEIIKDRIGFRSIETKGEKIILNGEQIFLKGISIHEESPLTPSRVKTKEEAEMLLNWAVELGCNFVRLAHYTHNEHMVRIAEEKGLMVWGEIPVYWAIEWQNKATYKNAENQLKTMIKRDRNRTNVCMWSVANETPNTKIRLDFLKSLIKTARKEDPTRLITAAINSMDMKKETVVIDDKLAEFLDVVGCNEYLGWYAPTPHSDIQNVKWKSKINKPLIMSEFGAGALAGNHGSANDIWTEEYQESIYKGQIKMLDKITFLAGTSPWILKDFRAPIRLLPGVQDYYNRKGLMSENGDRKKAFFVMQNYYKNK